MADRGHKDQGELLSFAGVVTRLVFRNEENGYSVIEVESGQMEWTLVGIMPYLAAGDDVEGQGLLTDHPAYGPQIQVRTISRSLPHGKDRIERYLASGALKGIGPATAKKLVAAFGDETLEVLRQQPKRVAAIRGVGLKKALSFQEQLAEDQGFQELMLLLLPYGIGPSRIMKIHKKLGSRAESLIRTNPYELASLVPGIGFLTADAIAAAVGIRGDHPARLRGAVLYALNQALFRDGHTVESMSDLIRSLSEQLVVGQDKIRQAVMDLISQGDLVRAGDLYGAWKVPSAPLAGGQGKWATAVRQLAQEFGAGDQGKKKEAAAGQESAEDRIALASVAVVEEALARRVALLSASKLTGPPDWQEAARQIQSVARQEDFQPGEEQYEALLMALTQPFSIITGGPGTGKTALVRLLTRILKEQGETILLGAPTGRAARRLSEVCKLPAQTLHRLLALQVQDDAMLDPSFWLTAEALDCQTLIVDECSMIDLFLFANLLSAVKPGTRLILIGDADQLPSIGPGQVLRDILLSQTVAHKRLTEIYRQEAHKLIVTNAHRILRGEDLDLDQSLESDFIFIDCEDEQVMQDSVLKLYRDVLPRYYGLDNPFKAQTLSAVRRGAAGVAELNRQLQLLARGPSFQGIDRGDQRFTSGDKVMQTRNNYELEWSDLESGRKGSGVMNGEMGVVQSVSLSQSSVTVLFEEERLAVIAGEDLKDLDLAYAVTIHKSQGSEYPFEILVIPSGAPAFLTRNLLYTGVTRAKEQLFLLTRKRTLAMMLKNNEANERQGMLRHWLSQ